MPYRLLITEHTPDGRFSEQQSRQQEGDLDKTEARILAIPRCWRTSEMCACPGGGTHVLIYVHGFNQTFETAALDAAQLSDAFKFRPDDGVLLAS